MTGTGVVGRCTRWACALGSTAARVNVALPTEIEGRVWLATFGNRPLAAIVGAWARPQRLLFASTETNDPQASDVIYIGALAAPNTVNTMPEETLLAFDAHGRVERTLRRDGGDGAARVAA